MYNHLTRNTKLNAFNLGGLTIPIPIIQGGMGIGVSLSGLASAVANMGGVGVISSVGIGLTGDGPVGNSKKSHIAALRREIRKARNLSNGILGVNIMTVITNFADMVRTSIDEGIDIIFSGAGLPLDLPKYLEGTSGPRLVPIVSSARAASIVSERWMHHFNYLPDAFVVEGPKAGGHLGFKADKLMQEGNTLENLLADILELTAKIKDKFNKNIPVIAAGGIFSGSDAYQIMKKGASAVQLGTRFVATEECDASVQFKEAFIEAKEKDIRIINSPVGMPGRAIFNDFLKGTYNGEKKPAVCKYRCIKSCEPKSISYCISNALLAAYKGDMKNGFAFAGANADRVNKITTVRDVFYEIGREYAAAKEEDQLILSDTW